MLVIFDTCDVVYNWSISLLPPIVLDNLFDENKYDIMLFFSINGEAENHELSLMPNSKLHMISFFKQTCVVM